MAQLIKRQTKARTDPDTGKVVRKAEARYDVRWRRPDGKTGNKTFRVLRDAESFIRQVGADDLAGIVTDPRRAKVTVNEMVEQWFAAKTTKRPRTVQRDRQILNTHVLPTLGDRRVAAVTRADLQEMVDKWAAGGLAASTVARQLSCFRAVLSYAEATGAIVRAPTKGIRRPQVRLVDRPQLDADQLQRLAAELGDDHAPMMWLGVVLGFRWSEAAGIRAQDVDLDGGFVRVAGQLGRDGEHVAPKSAAGLRNLAAPDWLVEMLKAQMAQQGITEPDGLLFTAGGRAPLHYPNWLRRVWMPARLRAGLPTLKFHDLRSIAATALIASGADLKTAQSRLGHSSPAMTLGLYARATATADRAASDAVGELFRPRRTD
jgi:integrase